MWLFRSSKPAATENVDDHGDDDYSEDTPSDSHAEFEYETGEEGDDEASKAHASFQLTSSSSTNNMKRPPIVPLGKDVLSVADSSIQTSIQTSNMTFVGDDDDEYDDGVMVESDSLIGGGGGGAAAAAAAQESLAKDKKKSNTSDNDDSSVHATNGACTMESCKDDDDDDEIIAQDEHSQDSHHDMDTDHDEEEDDYDDDDDDDDILDDGIPENVQVERHHGSRNRMPSALSVGDEELLAASLRDELDDDIDDDDDDDASSDEHDANDQEEEEDEPEVTSTAEKQSLLVLAAEHDRVDILQAILSDESEDRSTLLHATSSTSIPPLHIAASHGSVNATNCLLRMGADPSLRPDVAAIQKEQKLQGSPVDIPNMGRYENVSAWEIVFGTTDGETGTQKSSWSLFSPSKQTSNVSDSQRYDATLEKRSRHIEPVTMAPSKREGIRHAFTAEALRCIGSDEHERLRQLLNSGMPSSIDIGGKNLYDWSVEMSAAACEELLRPSEAARHESKENGDGGGESPTTVAADNVEKKSAVLDRPSAESTTHFLNRLDELESLSKALSTCLDNLAEEVSVSHGLLLMGGGASALASHVRSLKALKERKYDELMRMQDAWENTDDELAYWVKESGDEGIRIAELLSSSLVTESSNRRPPVAEAESPEGQKAQRQQLEAQIGASDTKIRKLRVSIADLSEENARNLHEVEKRGLSGGINLVRGLREEIREIEFELSEAKSAEATCRTKISLIQSSLQSTKKGSPSRTMQDSAEEPPLVPTQTRERDTFHPNKVADEAAASPVEHEGEKFSERIAAGHSTAMVVREPGDRGSFPRSLWQILMRIIGMGEDEVSRSERNVAHTAMII